MAVPNLQKPPNPHRTTNRPKATNVTNGPRLTRVPKWRFRGSDERSGGSKPSEQAQRSEDDERSKLSEKSKSDKQSGGPSGKVNVKEKWTGRYMYLPDEIDEQFDEFDRLVYECGQELDWKPKKNKHFYPVVVSQGDCSRRGDGCK